MFSAGSESENASGVLSVGSISDASSSTAIAGGTSRTSAQLKTRYYGPSLIRALRLAGIPDHYIRSLGGLRTPAKEFGRLLQPDPTTSQQDKPNQQQPYDVMEGVVEFLDDLDRPQSSKEGSKENSSEIFFESSVAEICNI